MRGLQQLKIWITLLVMRLTISAAKYINLTIKLSPAARKA